VNDFKGVTCCYFVYLKHVMLVTCGNVGLCSMENVVTVTFICCNLVAIH
jgi:hypothetical protein